MASSFVKCRGLATTLCHCVHRGASLRRFLPSIQGPMRMSTGVREPRYLPQSPLCLDTRTLCHAAAVAEARSVEAGSDGGLREDIRNIAIIAHVDHGKTTLVDAMLRQSQVFRDNQAITDRIMDSYDLERERGITIFSKNTAITYKNTKINIIDTPGHADFGGEVERVLNMCDGVLLLVDSVEGPMPQTRFVLRKALEMEKRVVLVVNKIDRDVARPDYVVNATFDLFLELGANDAQCDFPVIYASGIRGTSGESLDDLKDSLEPLFKSIVSEISAPRVMREAPLQMLVTNIDFQEHKGRIGIGRISAGGIKKADTICVCQEGVEENRTAKVTELFVYNDFRQVSVDLVEAGDICAVAGIPDIKIGETIADARNPTPLQTIEVEEPTVTMSFMVNTSPFAGREGKFVTSRNIKDRLDRELERNLALRVKPGATADTFIVSGRGGLHLGILVETMRREGYEFGVGPMNVIQKKIDGVKCEPFEEAVIEVAEEYVGSVVDVMGRRKGSMLDMAPGLGKTNILKYKIPTRGLIGLRNILLTESKGTAVLHTLFLGYEPDCGQMAVRENGSLTAHESGSVTSYALENLQSRGRFIVRPGDEVYEGQVVGENNRISDLRVNVCKKKQLNNIRQANKEAMVVLDKVIELSIDESLEFIKPDEIVEITPKSVRVRKSDLIKK